MQIETSRFGLLAYEKEDLIHFAGGLFGFEHLKDYLVLPLENNPAFYWLQSVEDGEVAFLVTDPFLFFPSYTVELDEEIRKKLAVEKREQVAVYVIVTVPSADVRDMTANLIGPLVINLASRRGEQYILYGTDYHTKHLLFTNQGSQAGGAGG